MSHDFINYGNLVLRDLLFCWAWGKTPREVFCSDCISFRALGAARPSFQEQSDDLGGELTLPFCDGESNMTERIKSI